MKKIKESHNLLKFVLINIILLILSFPQLAKTDEIISEYIVSTSGIKIGKFSWSININKNNYETKIFLKNSGLFSTFYQFEGEYVSKGKVYENKFKSNYYKQFWKTNKKTKTIEIFFEEKLIELIQKPEETEEARINFNKLIDYYDPITSFINILRGNDLVKTVDGRRVYTMKKIILGNKSLISIEIINYKNIWADHKRNDLNKIEFLLNENEMFPEKINIYFKERIFKLQSI
tara:strand:- start:5780 stop:6478 length:699 start_codon:yes stop_codon:yes gene_type:complete